MSVWGHRWVMGLLGGLVQPTAEGTPSSLRHAYLILGPAQVGKTTVARWFAQGLLCTHAQQRPCGRCRSCRLMARNLHPDLRLVQPMDRSGSVDRADGLLRAEQALEIVHEAYLRPMEGTYKVFVLQDMQTAHPAFANRLLKTLEEPPPHVIFCLTATDRSRLLPTVVSRCQPLELRPVAVDALEEALRVGWQADAERAALLARLANGRIGWAVRRLQDADAWQHYQDTLDQLRGLVRASRVERLLFSARLAADRDNDQLFALLELWISWWRDVMLAQAGYLESCSHIDRLSEITEVARATSPAQVRTYLQALTRIEGYLHHTVNTRLALDLLLLQMPRLADQPAAA